MIDVLDREIELILVPLWIAAVLAPAVGQHAHNAYRARNLCEVHRRARGRRQAGRPSGPNRHRLILEAVTKNRR